MAVRSELSAGGWERAAFGGVAHLILVTDGHLEQRDLREERHVGATTKGRRDPHCFYLVDLYVWIQGGKVVLSRSFK